MQFKNQTPFDALAFEGVDTHDREYHVVALAASYTLQRLEGATDWIAVPDDGRTGLPALPLTLGDEHWGDPQSTSLKRESDLVPYKPKCDVRWVGVAHAGAPASQFRAWMGIREGEETRLDKTLLLTGHRRFVRVGEETDGTAVPTYRLTAPEATSSVPLRYEYAFGGACQFSVPGEDRLSVNEVCYRNPLGRGWWARSFVDATKQAGGPWPEEMDAPQIWSGAPVAEWVVTPQSGSKTAKEMSAVVYPVEPAGFGPLGKAWSPRLALAGTYDDAWLKERHPDLPRDFDFGFWNGAPADMQIEFPNVTGAGVIVGVEGLMPSGGLTRWRIPAHRAYVLMRFDDGLVLPNPMQIDLIEVDNSDPATPPRMRLVWRTALLKSTSPRVLEARFETDPAAPLMKPMPSAHYERPNPSLIQSGS